ncbi:MAG: helical backbone metal receptor [Chloroflexi bacterium]|nr:helical backbone metal receptor [Chloroflexota bacterium]
MIPCTTSRRRSAGSIAIVGLLAALVAACTVSASPAPTGPAPTGSIVPAVTATPTAPPEAEPTPEIPVEAVFPVTLADDEGTDVTIEAEPERIVSLTPATTEILFAVGAGDRLVGRTDADDYPAEASSLPAVVTLGAVDVEKIVSLEPDLVIAGGNGFTPPEAVTRLRDVGVPVLVVYAPDVEGVLEDIELVGTAAGAPGPARDLAVRMRAEMDTIAAVLGPGERARPRVFYEIDATRDIYGPADDSFLAEMVSLAGGEPVTTGSPTSFAIPLERLIAADPEVIVLGDAAYGVTADQVAARPGWDVITAVATGAIRPVDDTDGLRALALAIDPAAPLPAVP